MSRQVRLVVGEGAQKKEVGVADVETAENGDLMVQMSITNVPMAALLGGNMVQGIIPKAVRIPPVPEEGPDV